MARIFITGSTDGLGQMVATSLATKGHSVMLHARNTARGHEALMAVPNAEGVLIGDLSDTDQTKTLAAELNAMGRFHAIIHNAGVYQASGKLIFTVNTLAPYILTSLVQKPRRLIYLGSDMHLQGDASLRNFSSDNGRITYADSKLHNVILAMAVARRWPEVYSNAVDPGWVPTKMGGAGAPDDLDKGADTQTWLAVSEDDNAKVSGHYLHHKKEARSRPEARDAGLQELFLSRCEQYTGVRFPD